MAQILDDEFDDRHGSFLEENLLTQIGSVDTVRAVLEDNQPRVSHRFSPVAWRYHASDRQTSLLIRCRAPPPRS